MPTGPKGERRPAYVIGNAVHVMKIPTGEIEDTIREENPHAVAIVSSEAPRAAKPERQSFQQNESTQSLQKRPTSDGTTSPRSAASA